MITFKMRESEYFARHFLFEDAVLTNQTKSAFQTPNTGLTLDMHFTTEIMGPLIPLVIHETSSSLLCLFILSVTSTTGSFQCMYDEFCMMNTSIFALLPTLNTHFSHQHNNDKQKIHNTDITVTSPRFNSWAALGKSLRLYNELNLSLW